MTNIKKFSLDYIFFFIGSFFALLANLFLGYHSLEELGLFNKSYAFFIIFGYYTAVLVMRSGEISFQNHSFLSCTAHRLASAIVW